MNKSVNTIQLNLAYKTQKKQTTVIQTQRYVPLYKKNDGSDCKSVHLITVGITNKESLLKWRRAFTINNLTKTQTVNNYSTTKNNNTVQLQDYSFSKYTSVPLSCNNVLLQEEIATCALKTKWPLNMCLQDLLTVQVLAPSQNSILPAYSNIRPE